MRACAVGLFLLFRLRCIAGINIGISLSFSGSYYETTSSYLELPVWARPATPPTGTGAVLRSERGCYYCDRVNQTLHVWVQLARAATGLDVQLTVMDDQGEWRRCRQNYRAMARDSSIDFLMGPSFAPWETAVNRIVDDESKLMISWVGTYPFYLTDFRTQLCPYCNEAWRTQIDWVDEMTEFQDTAFQTSLISTARPTGGRLETSPWVIPTQPDLKNLVRPALFGAQNAVMKQLTDVRNVTWGFAYFPNATRGEVSEAECIFFEEIVQNFSQASTVLLPMTTYITDSFQSRREFDVLVFCGNTNAFGQAMVKAQALNWRFEALITSFASGTRSLFRYGAGFVNYMAEPLAVPTVLPNATDAIVESFDALALAVGFEPDMASLQAATAASLLVQAVQASPSLSGADVRDTLRNSTFQTLFGPFGFDSSGNRVLQPFAFRQFLPSNIIPLQEAGVQLKRGEMNSNIVLVSPDILEVCRGDNSSVLCRDVVLEHMEFPMPAAAARYRQAYMCPDGTSLEGTNCVACARGFYRAGEMVSCEPCPTATFSDFPGAGSCRECPNVAKTCQPDATPVIMSGFFVFEGEFAWLSTTGFEPIKLTDFAFVMSGYYSIDDPSNLTKYTLEVPVTRGLSECAELCFAAGDDECVGLLFIIERARCVFYREGAEYFPWVTDNRTLLYLREEVYETAPRPDNTTRREYPQPPTDLQWAICPAPGACQGGTACTDALNRGLFCSQCVEGAATNSIFPSSRQCAFCPGFFLLFARMLLVMLFCVGLMMFLVLKARSAKGTYARIALPATKLLLCYACVLGTLADSNQLMLQGPIWFTLRIPLELLLRPWYMMQIDCLPIVLEWPASNETHGYVHHEMVLDLDRTVAVAGVCTIVTLSVLTLLTRLLYFCIASKAKAVRARNAAGEKFQQPGQFQSEATMNSQKLSESTEAHSEDTDSHVDHQVSRWTAFGKHGLSASAKTQLARYRFLFMHEEFLLYREVSKVIRRITIFAFWFMPVYLRTQVVPLRCLELEHINLGVLIEHPDVVCGSVVHDDLLTEWQFLWAIILYPCVWALIVLLSYRWKSEAATMEAVAFLNAGYKYGMYWWDVLMVGRSAASFLLMAVPGRILRIMSQMTLIAVISLLENSVKPWSRSNNGVLRRASNLLSAGLILTAAIAAWEVQQRQNEPNIILNITAALISAMAVLCSVGGILLLTLNVVFDEFFAPLRVLLQNGAATGSWTRMLYVATAWLAGGLHELHLWRGEDGRWVMNHSQLSRLERSGLVMLLVDILEQCLTLRGQFRMRQVETVLLLAFQNAAQVRRGTVQNDFYTHGTAHHPLTFWGFPRCSSQDPDISPNFDLKVTLTELQTALEMVSNDIQSGDPEVMTHTKASISTTEKRKHDGHDDDHYNSTEILIWDDDFGDIEGKVINHRQSQLMEHEDNMSQFRSKVLHLSEEGLNTHDGQRHLLRKLENMVNDEVDILLRDFDELAQEHISYVTNALGKDAQVVKKDIEESRALVSETAQWCEDPLPPFDRGDPEVSALALRKAEAARRAAILKDEVEAQATKVEACLQAYMDKAQESMQSAVQGTSVKGKRLLKKEMLEAQEKLNDIAVQLRTKVQESKSLPELPTSPRGPSGAAAPEVESAEELSDHGYNVSCFVAMCDKEAGAGAPAGPV